MTEEPNGAGRVCFELPLPPRALSPNDRTHWAVKAKYVRQYRLVAALTAQRAAGVFYRPMWTRAETRVVFYFSTNRRRDLDNAAAALKSAWDGIADAGLIANDSGLVHHPPEMRLDKARPRVEITIQEAP